MPYLQIESNSDMSDEERERIFSRRGTDRESLIGELRDSMRYMRPGDDIRVRIGNMEGMTEQEIKLALGGIRAKIAHVAREQKWPFVEKEGKRRRAYEVVEEEREGYRWLFVRRTG